MRKSLMVMVLLIAAITLVACGSNNNDGGVGPGEEGLKKLSMWVHISEDTLEGKAYKNRADAFNKAHEGEIEVQVQFVARGGGGTGYEDRVNAALTTNSLPDVLTLDGPNTAAYARSNILLDLTDYISEEVKEDFLPTALEQGMYEGGLYSLAIQESTVAVYYNKDMFVEAGLINSVETAEEDLGISVDQPWTFEEFREIGKKLTDYFDKPAIDLHLGSQDEWITYALAPFVWTSGGELISSDGLSAEGIFNSPESVKGFTFLKTLIDSGITTTTPEENAFEVGTYPMSLSGAWTIPILKYSFAETVPNWGILPYPVGDTGEMYVPTGSWAFGVSESSRFPEEAAKLAEWMTNSESAKLVTESTGLLPAVSSAYEGLARFDEGPDKLLMDQLFDAGKPRPSSVAYPEISFTFQQAVDRISSGYSVQDTLDQLTAQLEVKLSRHKR